MRKGLGLNRGRGYYNLVPKDPMVHSLSAKGVKTYENILYEPLKNLYLKSTPQEKRSITLRLKQFYLHGKGDREIDDHLTRKQTIDFLVHCGYNKKKVTAMSDDSLLTAFDIAKRKEKEVSDKCRNCGGTHEDTLGVCPDVIEHRHGGGDKEYSGESEGGEWLDAKGDVYDNLEKKDSGVRIIKGVNGWRIENDKGKILCDKVFNNQLEAFSYYKQNRYTLKAKFSIYGQKWTVLDKNKQTVLLKNKKGETLTITRDEYEQYKPKHYSVQEMIESVVNAKGKSVKVFDNGKDFTVIVGKNVYEMSDDAMMPNGVNIFLGEIDEFPDNKFGKQVKTFPDQVKRAIKEREPETELLAKGRNVKYKMSKEEKEMLAKETPYLKILRNTFKRMSNKENWKLPPKPFVTKSYPLALQVENTYDHFLGGSEMTELPDGTYKVTSKGYYHYIGE